VRARLLATVTVAAILLASVAWSCRSSGPDASVEEGPTAPATTQARVAAPVRKRSRVQLVDPVPDPTPEADPVVEKVSAPRRIDGEIPEDERGTGSAAVKLTLVNAVTSVPIESRVRMWRLGVPADEDWPAGDHIHDEFRIAGSRLVTDLLPGRYRLEVWAAAPGTDDPPEFEVRDGESNAVTLSVELPETKAMRLRVLNEFGVELITGRSRPMGDGSRSSPPLRGSTLGTAACPTNRQCRRLRRPP